MSTIGWKVKDPVGFTQRLVRALHRFGDEIFDLSQRRVPVDTGTLKKSGFIEYLPMGVRIGYRTSYASRQEFGIPPGTTEQVRRHVVKEHVRKLGAKRVIIPTHERGPYARVYVNGISGKLYLTSSWEEVRPKLAAAITRIAARG